MNLVKPLIVAAAVALPALSFAQSTQPLTRAQVREELVALQQAGYNPSSDETQYPRNIQQAEARLHAHDSVATTSYGGSTAGTSASGARVNGSDIPGLGPIFAHS
ncbi:DUF4148 domain-containing protein [Paraburkholderia sacchari]|uniref:DUF4148 domain-containing protein n=1 Tax=Paraburkholderia sacchari TaxID=159450 RepID=UPI000543761B|nr:DUF4148 domain-containing protein [Paraburkholderia sacchari]NLP63542.1 DUF4148 domain-containing protein [Paraburkholderia sacchari]